MASQALRQSVTVPADKAKKIRQYARKNKLTMSKALVELADRGLKLEEYQEKRFSELFRIVRDSNDEEEREKASAELMDLVFRS